MLPGQHFQIVKHAHGANFLLTLLIVGSSASVMQFFTVNVYKPPVTKNTLSRYLSGKKKIKKKTASRLVGGGHGKSCQE